MVGDRFATKTHDEGVPIGAHPTAANGITIWEYIFYDAQEIIQLLAFGYH